MSEKSADIWRVHYQFHSDDDHWQTKPIRDARWRVNRRSHLWRPPTDVLEMEEAYVVMVEVAGMRGAEFVVTYNKKILTIRGTRKDTSTQKAYHQMEIAYGEFSTEVRIQAPIDASKIEATYNDGFLKVVLPKSRPQHISISD
jgi:HSP20 family protein